MVQNRKIVRIMFGFCLAKTCEGEGLKVAKAAPTPPRSACGELGESRLAVPWLAGFLVKISNDWKRL